jgi:hypothetical protein
VGGSGTRRLFAAALLAGLGLAVSAAPAAASKLKTVTASATTSADDQAATATAICPKGKKAVGGGFFAATSSMGATVSDLYVVYESRRAGKRGWIVSGWRDDNGAPGPTLTLSASVNCRKVDGKIREVSGTASLAADPTATATATASCPKGTKAIAGGFAYAPPPSTGGALDFPLPYANLRLGRQSWIVSALNGGAAITTTLTSYVDCQDVSKPRLRSGTATLPATQGTLGTALSEACPRRLKPAAGGFQAPAPSAGGGGKPLPIFTESQRSGSQWRTSAVQGAGEPGTITADSYCS